MARVVFMAVVFWGGALVVVLVCGQVVRHCTGYFRTKREGDGDIDITSSPVAEPEAGSGK